MRVICPNCKRVLKASEKVMEHRVKCAECKTSFLVTLQDCLPERVQNSSISAKDNGILKQQFKWVMVISAVALSSVVAIIITVFVMKSSYLQEPQVTVHSQSATIKPNDSNKEFGEQTHNNLEKVTHEETKTGVQSTKNKLDSSLKTSKVSLRERLSQDVSESAKSYNDKKDITPAELSTSELVEKVDQSICKIETYSGCGTGFLISPNLIATNKHVVNFWGELNCYFPSRYEAYRAEIVWLNPSIDVAFLKLYEDSNLMAIDSSKWDEIKRGDNIIVIGYPSTSGSAISSAITKGILTSHFITS